MKTSLIFGRKSWTFGGALLLSAMITSVAGAQAAFNFSPGGFGANVCANSAPTAGCQIYTNGSPNLPTIVGNGVLRLNTATADQHASAWYNTPLPLNTGFTTAFQFNISGSPGDGLALVIQGDPAGTGAIGYTANGHNISYGNENVSGASGPGNAILNSLAVELDTYNNAEYHDPDGNHVAVQSCGPMPQTAAPSPSPNSADHTYICPDGLPALLGIQSLPAGSLLADGKTHTITVNYLPPGNCLELCNNFQVYLDSALLLQTTVDLSKKLILDANGAAYIGFTSATGAAVENNDIVSWSFSQLPLAPITITQPVQTTTTTFNFTPTLTATVDYSASGVSTSGVFMQSTVQSISDSDFTALVNNTPFQGSTCIRQDIGADPVTGKPTYACVTTTVLCTNSTSGTPAGANCTNGDAPGTIGTTNTFNSDPSQKPFTAPGYIMGKDTALSCGFAGNNGCKGLFSIFTGISGDPTVTGKTKNFNSVIVPIEGGPQPLTLATPAPLLNNSWTNQPVVLTLAGSDIVPSNNKGAFYPLPTVATITYNVTGANIPAAGAAGVITGPTGAITIPAASEGVTTVTYYSTDTSQTNEVVTTNSAGLISTALPTLTIKTDLTAPAVSCAAPAAVWSASDVSVPCSASDALSGLANPAQANFSLATAVPAGTETSGATTSTTTVYDVAGNHTNAGPFGPFLVDKKAPVISAITISPAAPVFGQAVTASYSCADGGSGVALCGSTNFAGVASTGTVTSSVDGSIGTHTFTVTATDAVGNTTSTPVTYTVAAGPQLSITPASIAFGTVKINTINAKLITVKNTGTAQVLFTSIKLTQTESDGGPGREFVMLNGCGSKLAVGKSCYVVIGFLADEVVSATGTVTFVDNVVGGPQTVAVSGNVVKK
jgi:hypothetical protein